MPFAPDTGASLRLSPRRWHFEARWLLPMMLFRNPLARRWPRPCSERNLAALLSAAAVHDVNALMSYARPGPTRTPCLSRWISGRCPYDRNRARSCRVEAGATSPASAADSTPNEPHDGQVYLKPRNWDDRIRSAAAPHNGQFAGSGCMVSNENCMNIQYQYSESQAEWKIVYICLMQHFHVRQLGAARQPADSCRGALIEHVSAREGHPGYQEAYSMCEGLP